jgi:hypothetical protein
MTSMQWIRQFPNSSNNFDLTLADPEQMDSARMNTFLDTILEEAHRGLSLSSRAKSEFRRWFDQPHTPLKSEAYVLLSNWFMTNSGDRHSTVASRCEDLWDSLFACRPKNRLSSPEAGRNHLMIPDEFQDFWRRLSDKQSETSSQGGRFPAGGNGLGVLVSKNQESESEKETHGERLRAKFEKDGLRCEVEGSSRAVADFLRRVSGWEAGQV